MIEEFVWKHLRDNSVPALVGIERIEAAVLRNELTHLISDRCPPTDVLARAKRKILFGKITNPFTVGFAGKRGFETVISANDESHFLLKAIHSKTSFLSPSIQQLMKDNDSAKYRDAIAEVIESDMDVLEKFAETIQIPKIISRVPLKTSTVYKAITRLKNVFADDFGNPATLDSLQRIAKSIFEDPVFSS